MIRTIGFRLNLGVPSSGVPFSAMPRPTILGETKIISQIENNYTFGPIILKKAIITLKTVEIQKA